MNQLVQCEIILYMETSGISGEYCYLVSRLKDAMGTFGIPQGKRDETKERGEKRLVYD